MRMHFFVFLALLCCAQNATAAQDATAALATDVRTVAPEQYDALVSAALEATRQVLGPRTEAENQKLNALWAPAFDFPGPEVIEYLDKLVPQLREFLRLRAAASTVRAQMEQAWTAVLQAAYYEEEAAAALAALDARQLAGQLRALVAAMQETQETIRALGSPPNPQELKRRARRRCDAAFGYVQKTVAPSALAMLQQTTHIAISQHGDFVRKTRGTGRIIRSPTTFGMNQADPNDPGAWKLGRPSNKSGTDMHGYFVPGEKWEEEKQLTSHEQHMWSFVDGHLPIVWEGRTFYGGLRRDQQEGKESAMWRGGIYGRVSADGKELEELVHVGWGYAKHRFGGQGYSIHGTALRHAARFDIRRHELRDTDDRQGWYNMEVLYALNPVSLEGEEERAESFPYWVDYSTTRGTILGKEHTTVITCPATRFQSVTVHFYAFQPSERAAALNRQREDKGFVETRMSREEMLRLLEQGDLYQRDLDHPFGKSLETEEVPVAPAPPPDPGPTAEALAEMEEKIKDREAVIKSIQGNIKSLQRRIADERRRKPPSPDIVGKMEYDLVCARSQLQREEDLIASLRTGRRVHTRTDYDRMTSRRFQQQCVAEVNKLGMASRERRNTLLLYRRLDAVARETAFNEMQRIYDSGDGLDPEKWKALRTRIQRGLQAELKAEKRRVDERTEAWEDRVWAAEWVKFGADTGMGIISGGTGHMAAKLAYSGVTSAVEKGVEAHLDGGPPEKVLENVLFYGGKGVVTDYSDVADYIWTGLDAYNANDEAGRPKSPARAVSEAVGTKFAVKWAAEKATGWLTAWVQKAAPEGPPPGWTPDDAFDYARFKQQEEMDTALVRDWTDTFKALRTAELKKAPAVEIAGLRAQLSQKTCSINASYGAKVILKYKAPPYVARGFSRQMGEVHEELVPDLQARLLADGFAGPNGDPLDFAEIRNASSGGTVGADHDLALREQPDWLPDGTGKLRRNVWLTRNGRPVSREVVMAAAQKHWRELYRQRTGYDVATSFENVTTSRHAEAYRDTAWIRGDLDCIDPRWAQQAGDVTRVKAYEMMHDQPGLLRLQRLQEACRGTGKDLRTKLLPALKKLGSDKAATMTPAERRHHREVTEFWQRTSEVLECYGRGDMDPVTVQRQIHLLSGGRGATDLVDRVGTMIETLGKQLAAGN